MKVADVTKSDDVIGEVVDATSIVGGAKSLAIAKYIELQRNTNAHMSGMGRGWGGVDA